VYISTGGSNCFTLSQPTTGPISTATEISINTHFTADSTTDHLQVLHPSLPLMIAWWYSQLLGMDMIWPLLMCVTVSSIYQDGY